MVRARQQKAVWRITLEQLIDDWAVSAFSPRQSKTLFPEQRQQAGAA